MQEDTKPKNDDVQDKGKKEPLTRSEYHGVITSYAGLALSLIAIVLSVITMYQSHMMETREIVQILRAEDDGYYHFDGETLFKNFQVTVANNSAIPVSIVEITIERDEETRTFAVSDLPDVLPLNMESNHTEMITIPWKIPLSNLEKHQIKLSHKNLGSEGNSHTIEPELLTSSRVGQNWKYAKEHLSEYYKVLFPKLDESEVSSRVSALMSFLDKGYNQKTLSLSIILHTAKSNQYVLTTEDMGATESASSEGSWVANRFIAEKESEAVSWAVSESTELSEEE